jgi:hypothetical protein
MFPSLIKINLPNCREVPREYLIAEPVVDSLIVFPAADGVVVGCREQQVVLWVPLDKLHVLRVA